MGFVELEVMLCIAGDFNAHVGVVELFLQKRQNHKITYRSGKQKIELVQLIVRKQEWKIKDGKVVAGEPFTT